MMRAGLAVAALTAWSLAAPVGQPASTTFAQKTRTLHTAEEFARLTGGNVAIRRQVDAAELARIREALVPLPVTSFTAIAVASPSVTWVGTTRGAIRLTESYGRREYFAGLRWLAEDHVTGFGFDGSSTWIETGRSYARIAYTPMTFEEKSRAFVERVQARHNRWGLTADSHLRVAGDLSTSRAMPSDNDGLWTAIYVAAEAFRYSVTRAADARDNARRGMQAIMRLESITGVPGFPARSFIKTGEEARPADGEWHDTPDGAWRWKGDTSSDEIVGHYFVYPLYLELVAEEAEKPALRAALDRITNHILDHGYQLVDVDGRRTRWGWWGPDAIWEDPDETGLRALELLSHLRVALSMTADDGHRLKYRKAYDDLIGTHKYHLLLRNQKVMVRGSINHSDDELAFLSFYPLLRYETDPRLLEAYRAGLARSWQIERAERNPLWNFIYAVGTGARDFDLAESIRTLQEIPIDQIRWSVRNAHRLDVPRDPFHDRFKRPQALVVLPYDELPMSKWNGNPYLLDGGSGGLSEDDGAYFLLPYWMGRHHGLLAGGEGSK